MSDEDEYEAEADVDVDEEGVQLMVMQLPLSSPPPAALVEFVDGTLMEYFFGASRESRSNQWCPRWVEHPDAVHRLAAIYDEWVLMHIGGKGAPTLHSFQRDVLDYHRLHLTGGDGVFSRCDDDGHVAYVPVHRTK